MARTPTPVTKLTPAKIEEFLGYLKEMPNVARAHRLCGVTLSALYKAKADDEEFAKAWDEAIEIGVQRLEEAAWERASKVSDALAMFLLKAHDPKYKDKIDVTSGGKPIQPPSIITVILPTTDDSPISPEDFE